MLYFNSRQLPELHDVSLKQRNQIVQRAVALLSTPQKTALNIIKLLLLTPIFLLLANIDDWTLLIYLLIVGILYPLVTNPITLLFAKPNISQAKNEILAESD